MSRRRGPTVHKLPALVGIVVVAAGLVAANRSGHAYHPTLRAAPTPVSGPSVPPADSVSSTWYCAEGTSSAGGRADETLVIANLTARATTATVTVLTGSARPPARRSLRIGALSQRRVAVSSIRATAEPGVIVTALTGGVVVEHQLTRGSASTLGPCDRQASTSWYFGHASTTAGVEDWLALFNPFPDDAIVDVTFLTPDGVQAPERGQAVVVPRESRVSLPLHQVLPDQSRLAVLVHARLGRVVAEQSLYSDGSNLPGGLTAMLGATAPARSWWIPTGDGEAGATATLTIGNFSNVSTHATVTVTLDNNTTVPAQRVSVPSMTVATVNVGQRVLAGTGYSVHVQAAPAAPVVPALLETWAAPATPTGLALTAPSTAASPQWVFATGGAPSGGSAQVAAVDIAGRSLTVQLVTGAAAGLRSTTRGTSRAVRSGHRVVFTLGAGGVGADAIVALRADGPIVAGRQVLAPDRSQTVGFPVLP